MHEPILDAFAVAGAALAGAVVTAAVIAAWHRYEIARLAESRRALQAQWRQLAELWAALDEPDRRAFRLTWTQRTLLALAVARAAMAPITDALDTVGGDRNGTPEEQAEPATQE